MSNPRRSSGDNSSNINKMRDIIRNTEENLMEAEFSKEFVDPMHKEIISAKNERRKQSIEELKEEMREEVSKIKKP